VIERLVRERLIDDLGGTYSIRRIGALLLAKKLDDFADLARKAPRVVVYTGTSKLETKLDQTGMKGYAVGFQGLVRFIMGQLPQNEVIKDALRREVKLVPEAAVRELVANALVHQDFAITGSSVMIEIYANRIELSNPGEPIRARGALYRWLPVPQRASRRTYAANGHLRRKKQRNRPGRFDR
jgi:predicted HTH transcriptional regulator